MEHTDPKLLDLRPAEPIARPERTCPRRLNAADAVAAARLSHVAGEPRELHLRQYGCGECAAAVADASHN